MPVTLRKGPISVVPKLELLHASTPSQTTEHVRKDDVRQKSNMATLGEDDPNENNSHEHSNISEPIPHVSKDNVVQKEVKEKICPIKGTHLETSGICTNEPKLPLHDLANTACDDEEMQTSNLVNRDDPETTCISNETDENLNVVEGGSKKESVQIPTHPTSRLTNVKTSDLVQKKILPDQEIDKREMETHDHLQVKEPFNVSSSPTSFSDSSVDYAKVTFLVKAEVHKPFNESESSVSSQSGYSGSGRTKRKRGQQGGKNHRRSSGPHYQTRMKTRSSPAGLGPGIPLRPSRLPAQEAVPEESPIRPLMECVPGGERRTVVVGPKSIAPPKGRPVMFQVHLESLREIPHSPLGPFAGNISKIEWWHVVVNGPRPREGYIQ